MNIKSKIIKVMSPEADNLADVTVLRNINDAIEKKKRILLRSFKSSKVYGGFHLNYFCVYNSPRNSWLTEGCERKEKWD